MSAFHLGDRMPVRNPASITIADCLFVLFLVGCISTVWRFVLIRESHSMSILGIDNFIWAEFWIPVLLVAPACAGWRMGRARSLRPYSGEIAGTISSALPVLMIASLFLLGAHAPLFYIVLFAYPLGLITLIAVGLWYWDSRRTLPWTHNLGIAFVLFHGVLMLLLVGYNMR